MVSDQRVFGESVSGTMEGWRSMVRRAPRRAPKAVPGTIRLDPGLSGAARGRLAAYVAETAARAATAGPSAALTVSCVRAIGEKLAATADGPVTIAAGRHLGPREALVVRRVLWSATDRARSGLAGTDPEVRDGMAALLAQWETAIGFDPVPSWTGPRMWGEPPADPAQAMFSEPSP